MSASTITMTDTAPREARSVSMVMTLLGLLLCVLGTIQITRLVTAKEKLLRDFVQEWTSARNWQVGRPIYQDMRVSIPYHLPKARAGDLHFNAHPPAAVLIALPFGSVRYFDALRAWNIVSLVCAAIALACLIGRPGFSLSGSERLLVCGLLLSSSVLETQVLHGQLNGLLLLLLTGAWLADRHERPMVAGVCVGVATALKLFPGLLVLFFLARKQWTAAIAAVVSFLMLNSVAAGVLGIEAFRDYLLVVMPQANRFCDTWPNASLLGFLKRLLDGAFGQTTPLVHSPWLARVLWVAMGTAALALTWRATARSRLPDNQRAAFAVWISLMLLVSPITWDHYFLLAVLPLIGLWKQTTGRIRTPNLFLICATVLLVVLSPYTVWSFFVPGYARLGMTPAVATPAMLMTVISVQFYVATALFVFGLRSLTEAGFAPSRLAESHFSADHS